MLNVYKSVKTKQILARKNLWRSHEYPVGKPILINGREYRVVDTKYEAEGTITVKIIWLQQLYSISAKLDLRKCKQKVLNDLYIRWKREGKTSDPDWKYHFQKIMMLIWHPEIRRECRKDMTLKDIEKLYRETQIERLVETIYTPRR